MPDRERQRITGPALSAWENEMTDKDTTTVMEEHVYGSMDEIEIEGQQIEYALIDGFKPGQKFRIGSVTAGDIIEWTEANEGEAKKTAGLRLICKSLVGPEPENKRYADDPKNIAKFRKFQHKIAERIVGDIIKLNGMTLKAEAAAKKD